MENNKHYDIGIYGWWGHENFGGCLTYYALNKTLTNLGYSVLMIQEGNGIEPRYTIPNTSVAMRFALSTYNCSEQLHINDLPSFNDVCDRFILGGDQMWNHYITFVKEDNFLSFVNNDRLKLSYSTSFGNRIQNAPKSFLDTMSPLLQRFNAVSVREDYAVDIAENEYSVQATEVIDAVFLIKPSEFTDLISRSTIAHPKEKYLVAFILNPTREKKSLVENIAAKLKLHPFYIPDAAVATHKDFYEIFGNDDCLKDLSVENFINLYANADYIVTDSFHGTCMSYVFRKPFSVIFNTDRGADRFEALMNVFNLKNRKVEIAWSKQEIESNDNISFSIDWSAAECNVNQRVKISLDWLKKSLSLDPHHSSAKFVPCLPKQMCMGCSACIATCPRKAISLRQDEYGYYRAFVDKNLCIKCGVCETICPYVNGKGSLNSTSPHLFAGINKNESDLHSSSSGGAFSVLAKKILKNKGYVCGVAWRDDGGCEYRLIDNESDLKLLNKSKYMQARTNGDLLREIKRKLDNKKLVMFVGTPCHVTGLRRFLRRDYNNLLAVDILCGNAPSEMFFKKYLEEKQISPSLYYDFRDKDYGWGCFVTTTSRNGEKQFLGNYKSDIYQSVYHNHTMTPVHCEHCKYQGLPRVGDISIGDFWGIENKDKSFDSKHGVSCILVNNKKGERFLKSVSSGFQILKKEPNEFLGGNGFTFYGNNYCSKQRNLFYKNIINDGFVNVVQKIHDLVGEVKDFPATDINPSPNSLLSLSKTNHFLFNTKWFNESSSDGMTILRLIPGMDIQGYRAFLKLSQPLKQGKKYSIKARFKIKSKSQVFNFHIYGNLNAFSVISSINISNRQNAFIVVNSDFVCNISDAKYLMIGACHVSGPDAYFQIDYVNINEKED